MPDESSNNSVPAAPSETQTLQVRADILPERQYATLKLQDPLPPALIERTGQLVIDDSQAVILTTAVPDDEIEIRADGFIYVSHEYCRRQLNAAFKPLGWSMVEGSPLIQRPGTNEYYQKWVMLINGVFAGVTMASRPLIDRNAAQDLSDVYESIKSDCVRRICKDLGLGIEAWNKRRQKEWRDQYAVAMVCKTKDGNRTMWRRRDADPFVNYEGKSIELGEAGKLPEDDGRRPEGQRQTAPRQPEPQPELRREAPRQANPEPEDAQVVEEKPAPAPAKVRTIMAAQLPTVWTYIKKAGLDQDLVSAMAFLHEQMGLAMVAGEPTKETFDKMAMQMPYNAIAGCTQKLNAIAAAKAQKAQ